MHPGDNDDQAWGWQSDLPTFYGAEPRVIRFSLERFVRDAGPEQVRAWSTAIPWLQEECRSLVHCDDSARTYTAILEYELPRESRRPDVIILENGSILVMELKGKAVPTRADLDQVLEPLAARQERAAHRAGDLGPNLNDAGHSASTAAVARGGAGKILVGRAARVWH